MADVARLAGVSHQTVSRVVNGHPSVHPATRSRVERAISQLGYRRNPAARALVTRRTGTIGVISVDTANYGPASTLFGIEEAARAFGHFVSFVSLRVVDRQHMRDALDHLMTANVDGIVVIAPIRAAVDSVAGIPADLPVLVVGEPASGAEVSVGIDQEYGARLATRHLLDLGHRTVHHVRGPHDWLEAEARVRGWQAELSSRGAQALPCPLGDWSPKSGHAAGRALAADPAVTAVFVANDQMAMGVLAAFHEAGRSVPADVSVVGFDDIPGAAYLRPGLTTIRQDFAEVGRRCMEHLLARMHGGTPERGGVVLPELVVRGSTAPPLA